MADGVKISALTETANVSGEEYIIINQDGITKRTKISNVQGATNLTDNYLELKADDGSTFRVKVDANGELIAYDPAVDTAEPAESGQNQLYDGLITTNHKNKAIITTTTKSFKYFITFLFIIPPYLILYVY